MKWKQLMKKWMPKTYPKFKHLNQMKIDTREIARAMKDKINLEACEAYDKMVGELHYKQAQLKIKREEEE